MKKIKLGLSNLEVPSLAVGCMRINGLDASAAENFVKTALDLGTNFFDHADIYGNGECEEVFARAIGMNPQIRERIFLQSKCGIVRSGMYNLSQEYIISSVDAILKRLQTDYLDVFLLHRPDALMDPAEIAETFDKLEASGKVRNFGVSNHDPATISLLKKYVKQPLVTNQLQLSITNASLITQGLNTNTEGDIACDRDDGALNFCRLNDITVQAWSPFQYGFFEGTFIGSDKYPKINALLDELAEKYQVSVTTIALAWILRHPANIMPVTGTTNVSRLADCARATDIYLDRADWYAIYRAAGYRLP